MIPIFFSSKMQQNVLGYMLPVKKKNKKKTTFYKHTHKGVLKKYRDWVCI